MKRDKRGGGLRHQAPARRRQYSLKGEPRYMELDIADRIALQGSFIWPATGSYDDNRVIEAIRKAVAFTPAEAERWGIEDHGNGSWRWETDTPDPSLPEPAIGDPDTRPRLPLDITRKFDIGARGAALIVAGLRALSAGGGISMEAKLAPGTANPTLSLYRKFIADPERKAAAEAAAAQSAIDAEIAALEAQEPAEEAETAPTDVPEFISDVPAVVESEFETAGVAPI